MFRVEDKYILSSDKMYEIESRVNVLLDPDENTLGCGRGYSVSSLYFDDFWDSSYGDSLNGVSDRDKYRIRIYNDSFEVIKLEIKRKHYNRSVKLSSQINRTELEMIISGMEIPDKGSLDDARTLFNLAMKTKGLRPRLIIAYDRSAYVESSGNVRITFDRDIRISENIDEWGTDTIDWIYQENNVSILEVKYDEFIPKYIVKSLEMNNMIQTANSKYGICRSLAEEKGKRLCL